MDNTGNLSVNVGTFAPEEKIILECDGLCKSYGSFPALNNISLRLTGGRIIGLLGPNGSGKTTLIKLIAGLLVPTSGRILIDGKEPGPETKAVVSYLPERTYLSDNVTINGLLDYFEDFYADFDRLRAGKMLSDLSIAPDAKIKTLSKGTKEKVQLVLVMSRRAKLYLLDEPIAGVDPAARDYILRTIIGNYDPEATIIISTHLIQDVEKVLDEFLFISGGQVFMRDTTDNVRENRGMSVDELFREVFRC